MKQTPRPTPRARTQRTPATRRNHAKTEREREQDPVQVRAWFINRKSENLMIFRPGIL